jgi:hypothetical protein
MFDLRTMKLEREEVVPEPTCPVCSQMQPDREEARPETPEPLIRK